MTLVVDRLQDDGTGNSDAVQDIIDGRAKAWGNINSSGNPQQTFNVSSGSDDGTGQFSWNLSVTFSDSAFDPVGGTDYAGGNTIKSFDFNRPDASTLKIVCREDGTPSDPVLAFMASFGTLA
jgi:hypothetical protein